MMNKFLCRKISVTAFCYASLLMLVSLFFLSARHLSAQQQVLSFFRADHSFIQYTGRIDFSNPKLPRFWQPGVYVTISFKGTYCDVIVNDEVLWGKNQNYLEVVLDGKPLRLQTKGKTDTIIAGRNLPNGKHTLVVCKNTEANIGYLEVAGFRCEELIEPPVMPTRKIECFGNSITCGTGSDVSAIPCGKGLWQDQHNAYMSYGAIAARSLNAQYHLSSVSGVGLIHSCCNMEITMPQVFDKVNMRSNSIGWDFNKYQPDVVTICLGQNDGVQDTAIFCAKYISFVETLRGYYPNAVFVLLSSPMADETIKTFMKKTLATVEWELRKKGDRNVYTYFFSRSYTAGCDYHPSLDEHTLIAGELTGAIKKIMNW